jgi:beta-glucuronidase
VPPPGLWDFQADAEDRGVAERWHAPRARALRLLRALHAPDVRTIALTNSTPALARRFAAERLPAPRQAAVPGSWGEQFPELRDYLGPCWYATSLTPPRTWTAAAGAAAAGPPPPRLLLRVGAANYAAAVYVNGVHVGSHEGGHLPFQMDVTHVVRGAAPASASRKSGVLRVVIRVEGLLSPSRVPPGALSARPQQYPNVSYDFFPYAGLHRAVTLLALPATHLEDVTVTTDVLGAVGVAREGVVRVAAVAASGWSGAGSVRLEERGGGGGVVASAALRFVDGKAATELRLSAPRLWSPASPALYTLTLTLRSSDAPPPSNAGDDEDEHAVDTYSLDIGVRSVRVVGDALLLNGAPLALRGFGKHEDAPLSGRGFNLPAAVRDAAAMKWTGANSYRTAHYPHAEASLALADREGLAVIDETPACYLCFHDDAATQAARLGACRRQIAELIARDKNHACVLLWSLANEPEANAHMATHGVAVPPPEDDSWRAAGQAFFASMFELARGLDASRPLTFAAHPASDVSWIQLCDVVCTNRYNGWYDKPGQPAAGAAKLGGALDREHEALRRPFILSEFGADAIAGTHAEPPEMWSEEYQVALIQAYLDLATGRPWLIGHHVWNLTDFKTPQAIRRPGGINHKGVFTRERRPKMAAHALRAAWTPAADAEAAAAGAAKAL